MSAAGQDRHGVSTGFLELSEHAHVHLNAVWMEIRGGGVGGDAYVARLFGHDASFGTQRTYLPVDASGASSTRRSGQLTWALALDGVYEFGKFTLRPLQTSTAWFLRRDGELLQIDRAAAHALARDMDAAGRPVHEPRALRSLVERWAMRQDLGGT